MMGKVLTRKNVLTYAGLSGKEFISQVKNHGHNVLSMATWGPLATISGIKGVKVGQGGSPVGQVRGLTCLISEPALTFFSASYIVAQSGLMMILYFLCLWHCVLYYIVLSSWGVSFWWMWFVRLGLTVANNTNRRALEKVKRDVICQDFGHSGLKMINTTGMQNAFLIQWVKKITMNHDSKCVYLPMHYYGELGTDLSVFGSNISS